MARLNQIIQLSFSARTSPIQHLRNTRKMECEMTHAVHPSRPLPSSIVFVSLFRPTVTALLLLAAVIPRGSVEAQYYNTHSGHPGRV